MTADNSLAATGLARARIAALGASKIREVADAGMGRADVLAFWFGESDTPTPAFIVQAAVDALQAGRTFYTQNLGITELREAIARYVSDVHHVPVPAARIAATSSGVTGLMLAMQSILDPGDRVVVVAPVWPNLPSIPQILAADVSLFPLAVANGAWQLDVDGLIAQLTPDIRLLLLNSPSNPTGWQIEPAQQRRLLDHCRRHGIWIIADEVYERLTYGGEACAPSFLRIADANDRLIVVNSFSKSWSMTGWRLGWLVLPPALVPQFPKLIEYNSSCAPEFVQVAAVTALRDGEAAVAELRARLKASRDVLMTGLRRLPDAEVPMPAGGMYAFFRLPVAKDSVAFAKQLVAETGLGLAPGAAFGPMGEGWLRWCFATRPEKLAQGLERLTRFCAR